MTARRLLANLLIAFGILALLEGFFALTENGSKYRASELLGYELVPGYNGRREHVNGAGVRGEPVGPRTPGSFRILAMGGSTTWGHKVADDETWPAQLQARLRRSGCAQAEVINGGVSGWGLEQVVIALRERALRQFQPDLVLVYCGWNWPVLADNPPIMRFRRTAAWSEHKDWLHHSAFVRWLDRKLEGWRSETAPAPAASDDDASDTTESGDPLPSNEVVAGAVANGAAVTPGAANPFPGRSGIHAVMQEAFPRLYLELAALCRERGVKLAVVRYPALAQLPLPDAPAARESYEDLLRTDRTSPLPLVELDRAARDEYASAMAIIDAAAPAAGIAELDVAARMFAAAGPDATAHWLDDFRDRMHLTPAGNAAIADALAALLPERGLLPLTAGAPLSH